MVDRSGDIYEPLDLSRDEIRVLKLKPCSYNRDRNEDEDRIICFLERTSLNDVVKYSALSYTWENGFDPQYISVSGNECLVSANLVDALREIRRESKEVVLWVDQLCINQDDRTEKASQIQNMRSIYRRATRVIAWLGIAADNSDLVLITLHYIDRYKNLSTETSLLSAIAQELQKSIPASSDQIWDVNKVLDNLKTALPALAARRYWNRLWVLQEFILARKLYIMCGSIIITDDTLGDAWIKLKKPTTTLLRGTLTREHSVIRKMVDITETWDTDSTWWDAWLGVQRLISQRHGYPSPQELQRESEFTLFKLMFRTMTTFYGQTRMSSSDPRDRVFGLLGLTTDSQEFHSFPDYTRSTESIYEELAQVFIQQGNVDTLSFCQENPIKRARSMASWAADWSLSVRIPLWGKLPINASQGWSGDLAASVLDSKTITISGACVGTIQSHGDLSPDDKALSLLQMQTYLHQLRALCNKSDLIHADEEESVCAQIAAPSAMAFLGNIKHMLTEYRAIHKHLEESAELLTATSSGSDIQFTSRYESELRLQLFRCPFITTNGYVGIAPPFIQQGDCVCIFPGGRMLYILRQQSEGDRLILVGAAYVYGVMNGEYFERKREIRSFNIT